MENTIEIWHENTSMYVSYEVSGYNSERDEDFSYRRTECLNCDDIFNLTSDDHAEWTPSFSQGEVISHLMSYLKRQNESCEICIFNWWLV